MNIYLDYNLFAYLYAETKPGLRDKVEELSDRCRFPYSPAHMEEIATALMIPSSVSQIDRLAIAFRKLDSVSLISRNFALLPADAGPMVMKEEKPFDCFRRVVQYYDRNAVIEEREHMLLAGFKEGDPTGRLANRRSNLPKNFLIDTPHGHTLLAKLHFDSTLPRICKGFGVKRFTWPEIADHYPVLERAVEVAMNFMEQVRYRPEDVSKSRSRMHDVTHCIYASGCEIFVTSDKRLYDKVKAVYAYFHIPTHVLMLDEFVQGDYELQSSSTHKLFV